MTGRPRCSASFSEAIRIQVSRFGRLVTPGCGRVAVCCNQRSGSLGSRQNELAVLLHHSAFDSGAWGQVNLAHRFLGPTLVARAEDPVTAGRHAFVTRHEDSSRLGVQAGVADGASGEELDHARAWILLRLGRRRRLGRGSRCGRGGRCGLLGRGDGRRRRRLGRSVRSGRACTAGGLWFANNGSRRTDGRRAGGRGAGDLRSCFGRRRSCGAGHCGY